jgi:hypothetical protein
MKVLGILCAALGLGLLVLGLVRHQTAFILKGTSHASTLLGLSGLMLLIFGGILLLVGVMVQD